MKRMTGNLFLVIDGLTCSWILIEKQTDIERGNAAIRKINSTEVLISFHPGKWNVILLCLMLIIMVDGISPATSALT